MLASVALELESASTLAVDEPESAGSVTLDASACALSLGGNMQRSKWIESAVAAAICLGGSSALAADHLDSKSVMEDPAADITDVYAWAQGSNLVLVLDVAGIQLTWPDGGTDNTYTVSSAGTYTVQANAGGCLMSDVITVGYTPLPIPQLGDDRQLCEGDSLRLNVAAV